ncbi:MAG TPA: 16S rRNA (cytosine(967)-C(5))-methyltransferase RsmB [Terriglobia bacterium]|nr:16S rRNA (cytosine(967)-C(5))-methyltransferase RsmB [Terriglobia bacterium]
MPTPARKAALEILLRVETQASYAGELLHGPLTAQLSAREAGLCTELVMGSLRWQGTLDFLAQTLSEGRWEKFDPEVRVALRLGMYQLRFLSRIPARSAVHESVELVKEAGKASAAGLVNAVLRKAGDVELAALRPAGMSDLDWWSVETSHPNWLLGRWIERFGREQALALARANNQPPQVYLRLNTAPLDSAQITEQLLVEGMEVRPGNFLKTALRVESGAVSRTQAFRRGFVVVQDEASQIVPHLLDVRPGQRLLDLCAAPGNKTGLLAQWAGPKGLVVACDIHLHRLRQFTPPPPRTNVQRVALDGERTLPFAAEFDRILVDAPCSGTGTLRRNPELKWRLQPAEIALLAEKQLRLLDNAAQAVQHGGRMVYSTCSLEQEENQGVVDAFLKTHPDFRRLPVRDDVARLRPFFHPAAERLLSGEYLETSPARDELDGFFAAILVRS